MDERCTASAMIVDDSVSGGIPSNVRERSMFELSCYEDGHAPTW